MCKDYLESKGYTITYEPYINIQCDFIAKSNNINKVDLLIDVKYITYLSEMNNIKLTTRLLSIAKSYYSEKQFKLVALVYTEDTMNNKKNYIDITYSSDNLIIIYISDLLSLDIDDYLNNLIDNEDSNMQMDEIAYTID